MDTKNSHATVSTDPIAGVRLWPLLVLVSIAGVMAMVLMAPASSVSETKTVEVAFFASIIVWWGVVVVGATQRAGFRPATPKATAIARLSSKVVLCTILATVAWVQLQNMLELQRVGLVTAPALLPREPSAETILFVVFEVALLGPVAEEMLFRGTLFRKWRLRWGAGKTAVLTSALFGLGHPNAPAAILFALSMTLLYTTTRTLWAPLVAHVLNNLLNVIVSISRPLLPVVVREAAASWPGQLTFLIAGALSIWWLARFIRRGWHTLGDPVHVQAATVTLLAPARS